MNLGKIINKKLDWAKYMVDEITYICKNIEKRAPGSEGEKKACEYMAKVLKEDCGCERADVEAFKENPGSFYGWLYFTLSFVLAAIVFYFIAPIVSVILIVAGLVLAVLQFGLYFKTIDKVFPEKTGHNVTAIKKCTGETKRRIIFNGHPDAAWEWPVNYALGGVGFEGHAIIGFLGAFYYLILAVIQMVQNGMGGADISTPLGKAGLWGLIFVPFLIGLYFMVNYKIVVDGANDNLSGCYMGIALLKALKDEFNDVPTFIYSYDTIHDPKFLMVNYRDLNGTVKADKDVGDLFMESANELNVQCKKGMVPPLGGSTDTSAFAQAGMRAAGITGLNHKLESYYHTRRDTYDNMDIKGLADCFAATVKVLEKFDEGAKQ